MQTSDLNVNNTESDHANAIFRQFQDQAGGGGKGTSHTFS